MMKRLYFFCGIFFFNLIIYHQVIFEEQTVNPDAYLIYPQLDSIKSLSEYFKLLFSFQLFDVQPVRDLSYYLDLYAFNNFNVNFGIFQNIVIWTLIVQLFHTLLQSIFPKLDKLNVLFFTLLFASNPIFSVTISWGIARKHLLSMLFLILGTNYVIKHADEFFSLEKKSIFLVTLFYTLSVFSQPISILWPTWLILFGHITGVSWRNYLRAVLPLLVIFLICFVLNSLYYKQSPSFAMYFESKTNQLGNIGDNILGLGHYVFQTFFPFSLSASYTISDWPTLAGLFFLIILFLLVVVLRIDKKKVVLWSAYYLAPLAVVLVNPRILSDNYLVIPMVGFYLILVMIWNKLKMRTNLRHTVIVILLFTQSAYTYRETSYWIDTLRFSYERSFKRRPNCDGAIGHARKSYAIQGKVERDVLDYILHNQCLDKRANVAAAFLDLMYLRTYILVFEDEISDELKESELKKMSHMHYYPKFALAGLMAKKGDEEEFNKLISEVNSNIEQITNDNRADYYIRNYLYPYCARIQHVECLRAVKPLAEAPRTFYL